MTWVGSWKTWLNYVKHIMSRKWGNQSICLRCTRYEEQVIFIAGEITKQRRKISSLCPAFCYMSSCLRCPFWTKPWPINKEPKLTNTVSELPMNSHKCFPITSYCICIYYGYLKSRRSEKLAIGLNKRCGERPVRAVWLKKRGDRCQRWAHRQGHWSKITESWAVRGSLA